MTPSPQHAWPAYSGVDLSSAPGQAWALVHVGKNRDQTLADLCVRKGIAFFLPALVTKRTVRPRKPLSRRLLWPQYLLCRLDPPRANLLQQLSFVTSIAQVANEDVVLARCRELKTDIDTGQFSADIVDIGDIARITAGAFMGMEGTVASVPAEKKIRLNIDMIGQAVTIEVDRDYVDTLREAPPLEPQDSSERMSAAVEAINLELIKYLSRHPEAMYDISPRKFEELIAELLRDMGYDVWLTPPAKDGGRDVLAVFQLPDGEVLTVVECKRFAPHNRIGPDILHRLLWVADRQDKASRAMLATTSRFTAGAKAIEEEYRWRLSLHDFDGVSEWLSTYGTWEAKGKGGLWLPAAPVILQAGSGQGEARAEQPDRTRLR